MISRRWLLITCFCLLTASHAEAHFLFIRILPPADGGRFAEVYFSEQVQAGDPRFVDKIAGTKLWIQSSPGEFLPLKVHKTDDRLRAPLPDSGNVMVIGSCTYGVLQRKVPFLLRHFPKAMAGDPEQLKLMKPLPKVPLEIVGISGAEGMRLTALLNGKPMANVEFNTLASDLSGTKLKAGADGSVTWKPSKPGTYTVYVSHFSKTAGKYEDAKYEEIRDFATLSFTWNRSTPPARRLGGS